MNSTLRRKRSKLTYDVRNKYFGPDAWAVIENSDRIRQTKLDVSELLGFGNPNKAIRLNITGQTFHSLHRHYDKPLATFYIHHVFGSGMSQLQVKFLMLNNYLPLTLLSCI